MTSTAYSKYVPKHERPVISKLLELALVDGNTISVHDSEEFIVKRKGKVTDIRPALGGTGDDTLVIRDKDGNKLGYFWLIFNNGSEDDPTIVIADYAANEYCNAIYEELYKTYSPS